MPVILKAVDVISILGHQLWASPKKSWKYSTSDSWRTAARMVQAAKAARQPFIEGLFSRLKDYPYKVLERHSRTGEWVIGLHQTFGGAWNHAGGTHIVQTRTSAELERQVLGASSGTPAGAEPSTGAGRGQRRSRSGRRREPLYKLPRPIITPKVVVSCRRRVMRPLLKSRKDFRNGAQVVIRGR